MEKRTVTEKTIPMPSFSEPKMVSLYAENTAQMVPALHDLHRMIAIFFAERAPANRHVLVLGAGEDLS